MPLPSSSGQPTPEAERLGVPETPLQQALASFRRDRLAVAGFCVLVAVLVVSVVGKVLTEWWVVLDCRTIRLADTLKPPLASASPGLSAEPFGVYWFGTDELGRSVFARMLQGASVSLSTGLVAVSISLSIGVTLGGIAGYYGSRKLGPFSVDALIMRFTDVALCFPSFFLILTVVALLPPGIFMVMIVIGATSWMGTARFVRAEFLALRELDFVLAARALGLPEWRIIFRHMLPNAMAPVFVSSSIDVASAILTESALSFLGFGVQPPHATWGNILADGRGYIFDAPWLFVIPGTAILVVVLAFNLVGEGLREAFSPRLRRRRG